MKDLLLAAGMTLLAFVLSWFGHWMLGYAACLLLLLWESPRPWRAALVGLVVFAVVWGGTAGWIDARNGSLLSRQIGNLFGGLSPALMIVVSALIGGIGGALVCGTLGAFLQPKR